MLECCSATLLYWRDHPCASGNQIAVAEAAPFWHPTGHPVVHQDRQGAFHQPVDGRAADGRPPDPDTLHERQAGSPEHGLVRTQNDD